MDTLGLSARSSALLGSLSRSWPEAPQVCLGDGGTRAWALGSSSHPLHPHLSGQQAWPEGREGPSSGRGPGPGLRVVQAPGDPRGGKALWERGWVGGRSLAA